MKQRIAAGVLACLVGLPLASAETPAPPEVARLWVDAAPEQTERVVTQLRTERVKDAAFNGTPLEEVLQLFEHEHGVPTRLDALSLDDLGLGPDEPIHYRAPKNVPIGTALRMLLEPLELTYRVDAGVLVVTTEEENLCCLKTAAYPVTDLLHDGDFDPLISLITSTIAAETWAENGGGESEVRPYPQRGALVITQTTEVHEQVLGLLSALRRIAVDPNAKPLPEPSWGGGLGGSCCVPTSKPVAPPVSPASDRE